MSAAGHLDHWWVSEQWLKDIALSQYAPKFREHLVDGRVLASLTKKDLEKYMGMNNRYHQESMIYGIKMLKMFNFDVKVGWLLRDLMPPPRIVRVPLCVTS